MPGRAPTDPAPALSVVVPLLNAAQKLPALHSRITSVVAGLGRPTEVIFVDDGSTDSTWEQITRLAEVDPRVGGFRLAENVGQVGALCAGFSVASGPVILMLDDDIEVDPAECEPFIAAIENGADFASGWRRGPRPLSRAFGSWLYNRRLRSLGISFHDSGCGFNALSHSLARELSRRGWDVRGQRFKPTVATLTERIVEIAVSTQSTSGSHYHLRDLAASWLDVELAFRRFDVRQYLATTVVAPLALAAVALRRRGQGWGRAGRVVTGVVAGAAVTTAFTALQILRTRQAQERRAQSVPAFEIAECVGMAVSSAVPGPSLPAFEELGP